MIVVAAAPHVFSMRDDLTTSPFLLVYDNLGKLSTVYTRDERTNAWVKNDTAAEQIGDTITKYSVRFSFDTARERDTFLETLEGVADKYRRSKRIVRTEVATIIELLASSRPGPVVLPVAIAKPTKTVKV
jgi:hypothetical protein